MRCIGKLPEEQATVMINYLQAHSVTAIARKGKDDHTEIWIEDENDLATAKVYLQEYRADPRAEKFQQLPISAPSVKKTRTRYIDVRTQIFHRPALKTVTTTLIVISVLVFIARQVMPGLDVWLIYSGYISPMFKEIRAGEVWRLLTPIFLHFNIIHIVFNMIWLYILGNQIEQREGGKHVLLLTVAIGIVSNTCQYLTADSIFGGFSGVVYGLLGYVWIMSRFKPRSGYLLDNFTLIFMLVWLLMGIVGMVGGIANAAHLFGFISGVLWGLIASGQLAIRRKRE